MSIQDDPYRGLWVGAFIMGKTFTQELQSSPLPETGDHPELLKDVVTSQVSKNARPGATRLRSAIPRAFAALQDRAGYFFGSSRISRARRLPMISRQLARSW